MTISDLLKYNLCKEIIHPRWKEYHFYNNTIQFDLCFDLISNEIILYIEKDGIYLKRKISYKDLG